MSEALRILFINNDPGIYALVTDALRASFPDLHVTGVTGADSLARALEVGAYDLAVTDYSLGWADGSTVVARVKERWPDCPVVLFSVSGEDQAALEQAKSSEPGSAGAQPESVMLLAGTVRAALERSELQRERRQAEEALRISEARFRSVFESATDAIILAGTDGRILSWNRGAQAAFGYAEEEIVGRPLSDLMPERFRVRHEKALERYRRTRQAKLIGRTLELRGLRRDGSEFPIELAIGVWETGQGPNFSGIIRDITQRKRAEAELRRSYRQLQRLSAHVASIQERERTAIAREIHDELGQALTAMRIEIAWLQKRLATPSFDREALQLRLAALSEQVDATLGQVRRISAELRPRLLDEIGLVAALEWQAQDFQSRTGIRCTVRSALAEDDLDREPSTALFRIFQECLTNVARHSGATCAETTVRRDRGRVVLEVRDDGSGISPEAVGSPHSLGLLGIQERTRLLGGQVRIRGEIAGGTRVTVSIPQARRTAAARAERRVLV